MASRESSDLDTNPTAGPPSGSWRVSSLPRQRVGAAARAANPTAMLSALMMLRRVLPAFRYAISEEEFLPILSAGLVLIVVGTLTYTLGQDWHVVDALYFSVSTLTTTSVSNPELVLTDRWLEIFTVLYQLVGIGILVEILRRLGVAFITVRKQEKAQPPLPEG
jgi:hypothetical protein